MQMIETTVSLPRNQVHGLWYGMPWQICPISSRQYSTCHHATQAGQIYIWWRKCTDPNKEIYRARYYCTSSWVVMAATYMNFPHSARCLTVQSLWLSLLYLQHQGPRNQASLAVDSIMTHLIITVVAQQRNAAALHSYTLDTLPLVSRTACNTIYF